MSNLRLNIGQAIVVSTLIGLVFWAVVGCAVIKVVGATEFQCGYKAAERPLTVSLDPDLASAGVTRDTALQAFDRWNALWIKYHGFPIFVEASGDWESADILVTTHGWATTWVQNPCLPGFVQRGNNKAIVFVGVSESWRNGTWFVHELGHALGLPDFALSASPGSVGVKPCGAYIGIMSYCTSPQAWLLDLGSPGLYDDGAMVRDFYK